MVSLYSSLTNNPVSKHVSVKGGIGNSLPHICRHRHHGSVLSRSNLDTFKHSQVAIVANFHLPNHTICRNTNPVISHCGGGEGDKTKAPGSSGPLTLKRCCLAGLGLCRPVTFSRRYNARAVQMTGDLLESVLPARDNGPDLVVGSGAWGCRVVWLAVTSYLVRFLKRNAAEVVS